MFTHWLKIYSVPLVLGIAGAGLYVGAASAGTCELADGNRDTGWMLTFDDAQVSDCVFTGNAGTGRNKGTLALTLNVANAKPIDIGFVQEVAPAEDSFGLRITWNLTLNNNYQVLRGIRGRAFDNTEKLDDDENEFVENAHPGFAHFHNDGTFNPGPFVGAEDCDCESDRDFKIKGEDHGVFSLGTGSITGIGVHQIQEQGRVRSFSVSVEPLEAEVK
jgi:hypothetical protein